MSAVVWKYPIPLAVGPFVLDLPRGATVVHVEAQHGLPFLWALVDAAAPEVARSFVVVGTGQPAPDLDEGRYVGSFLLLRGNFVGHLFVEAS